MLTNGFLDMTFMAVVETNAVSQSEFLPLQLKTYSRYNTYRRFKQRLQHVIHQLVNHLHTFISFTFYIRLLGNVIMKFHRTKLSTKINCATFKRL